MRYLVLCGGGIHASFEIGVLKELLTYNGSDFYYDALYGSSAGAMNCAFLSMFPKEEMKSAVLDLEQHWLNMSRTWPAPKSGIFHALQSYICCSNAMNSLDDMGQFMDSMLDFSLVGTTPLYVSSMDIRNRCCVVSRLERPSSTDRVQRLKDMERNKKLLLSSASIPFVWPSVSVSSRGGTRRVLADALTVLPIPLPKYDPEIVQYIDIILPINTKVEKVHSSDDGVKEIGLSIAYTTFEMATDHILEIARLQFGNRARMYSPTSMSTVDKGFLVVNKRHIAEMIDKGSTFFCSNPQGQRAQPRKPIVYE